MPAESPTPRAAAIAHTPGPWRVSCGGTAVDLPNGSQIRQVRTNGSSLANARLIAAAPEMLAALHAICDAPMASMWAPTSAAIYAARDLIARTEGRS